ncbi:S41 family peptidase [Arachidicoccus ginsenosidimutans]|uniref:S41 family peptidase n=1 Tax=Arachidicoccus sp. BS20 TaxID=1850526 RepID=UPI0018D43420|nr:S41 family peptidase [Arachidicoccus sp. BS20]
MTPFAYFTLINLNLPGAISIGDTSSTGKYCGGVATTEHYNGKVVIIVNTSTQSNGEFTAMALSTVPNAKVIGSTTAGADGNVSIIRLPGGIATWISDLGVYYPDGTEAQRKGVKIDIPIKPTIKGIREGKDELLDKAMQIIESK